MNKKFTILLLILLISVVTGLQWLISSDSKTERERRKMVDTRIDNNGYYKRLATKGLYTLNPEMQPAKAIFTGSKINAFSVRTDDSPDVPVTTISSTQSENSIFVSPLNNETVLNSNNSTNASASTLYGANDLYSFNSGETWGGKVQGVAGSNSGDPAVVMGWNGRWYVNYISSPGGQGIGYSDNNGASWTSKIIAPNPGDLADKNHLWIDNSLSSPYEGYLYNVWTDFGGVNNNQIVVSRSTNDAETWSTRVPISNAVNAGSHNQGVNVHTGPSGEVYAVWAIYNSWPSDEGALGFAKSLNGGETWQPANRIINNIRGIRNTETKKNHRVASFPSMAVDISNGPDRGTIYVVWPNIGVPGVNQNNGIDVYLIKSTDQGATWTTPTRVNQNPIGLGKEHYMPWITCDPENGILSVVFYGDRNVSQTQVEVFCANSMDAGETWEDFKVSDVAFTPSPIPGLAGGYMGDYLGISARGGKVYPVWPDNRSGVTISYCSPYETNPLSRPFNLVGSVDFPTGNVSLTWDYEVAPDFTGFNIYRGTELIGTSNTNDFVDALPAYGVYIYAVTATYTGEGESSASRVTMQWGDAQIEVSPSEIYQVLMPDSIASQTLTISNVGQLPMEFGVSSEIIEVNRDTKAYCAGSGGGDEYISRVQIGTIDKTSAESGYADYTLLSTEVKGGEPITLTVTNGNPYSADQCGVWIDWNQNEIFDDAPVVVSGTPGNGPYTAIIEPPVGAKSGATRMRIRITYTGAVSPCGTTTYGEVEDYTLNVISWLSYQPSVGTIAPGESMEITVTLKAVDIEEGDYYANLKISNNDPDNELVIVPVHLKVSNFIIEAVADVNAVCKGDSVHLSSTVTGATAAVTYFWKSEGVVVSEIQNPVLAPEMSTEYFAYAVQGADTIVSAPLSITVYDLPEVMLGDDMTYCGENVLTIDAANEGATYLWSTGETTQTIEASVALLGYGTHQLFVDVTNSNGCMSSDTIQLTYFELPTVSLTDGQTACGTEVVIFDAQNEGATFLWSNGSTTQTLNAAAAEFGVGEHSLWVQVTDQNGCVASDTSMVKFFEAPPVVNFGADTTLCGSQSKELKVELTGYEYLWSTGATTSTIVADTNGNGFGMQTYWVELKSVDACVTRSEEIKIEFINCSSILENDAIRLSVYPNPGTGLFKLEMQSASRERVRILVYDASGNLIYQRKDVSPSSVSVHEINLLDQPSGVYNLVVEGKQSFTKRLIINR